MTAAVLPVLAADPGSPAGEKIGCNRRLAIRVAVLAALLSWPLLVFGRPAYFPDSVVYYKGGQAAFRYAGDIIAPASQPQIVGGQAAILPRTAQDAGGARSIPYSVTAYLLSGRTLTMLPLVLLHIAVVAFAVAVLLAALGLPDRAFGGTAVLLAFATPAAWFTDYAMPDIFAGVTIVVIAVMVVHGDRLTRPVAIPLGLIGGFAIASHPSHIALALVLLPVALAGRFGMPGKRALLWAAAPVGLGLLAAIGSGLVGFGEISLAPRHYPLTLARAIEDGPARWYLNQHCRSLDYVVCRLYPGGLPATADEFLWGANGIRRRASAAQMDRIRGEEREILLATAAAYPMRQLTDAARGTARQLVTFAVDEADFNVDIVRSADGGVHFAPDRRVSEPALRRVNGIVWTSALIAAAGLIIGLFRARGRRRALAGLLVAGLIANAAICAILSGVDDRYQARVIWLLPLAAIAVLLPARRAPVIK